MLFATTLLLTSPKPLSEDYAPQGVQGEHSFGAIVKELNQKELDSEQGVSVF
jgi:hypothetical protein